MRLIQSGVVAVGVAGESGNDSAGAATGPEHGRHEWPAPIALSAAMFEVLVELGLVPSAGATRVETYGTVGSEWWTASRCSLVRPAGISTGSPASCRACGGRAGSPGRVRHDATSWS